jgi:spore coat polysaccharide biosynthesis protein SpsF
MTLGVIIQARMGSTRLPGKVLKDIAGKPLLGHIVGRLGHLHHPIGIVVATSLLDKDNAIANWCDFQGVDSFRGSETDVLDRYLQCAEMFGFDNIVRLTADNPFPDIEELDRLIALHLHEKSDYAHSFGQLPIGVGAEIFAIDSLRRSHREGLAPHHREHVNEYIPEHPELFKISVLAIPPSKVRPDLRLTVDTVQDYQRACNLVPQARGEWLTTEEAIALCLRSA